MNCLQIHVECQGLCLQNINDEITTCVVHYCLGVHNITGILVYPDLGVLRYLLRYDFDVPVHSANSVKFLEHNSSAFVSSCILVVCQFLFNLA